MTTITWMLICSAMMFFMQAGFTCFETGLVQSKNVVSVAIENLFNLAVCILVFTLAGYYILTGTHPSGTEGDAVFFVQLMFAATSVTIFAAALSERTHILPLIIAGAFSALLIYPVFARFSWQSYFTGSQSWLERIGYIDMAGVGVVHMCAGFTALAGLIVVGKRLYRDPAHTNIPLAVLGIFILWFGWFGFNGCRVAPDSVRLPLVFINVTMAGAGGIVGSMIVNVWRQKNAGYLFAGFDGILSGLVAITASSAFCSPIAAALIGLIAGVFAELAVHVLNKFEIDDVVHVVPIHLVGGMVGSLTIPLFIIGDCVAASSRLAQLGAQLIGVATCFVWVFGLSFIMFKILDKTIGLRVSEEEEKKGLNIVEFDDVYSWENYRETSNYENKIHEKNKLLRKQARLLAVTEQQEKEKLARDLHDGVGQSLSAMKVILGMGKAQAAAGNAEAYVNTAAKASELADASVKEMRNVLNNLRPEALEKNGLKAGIKALISNIRHIDGLSCNLEIDDPIPSFDETIELNLYRLIQESLTNVVKHAEAHNVTITCQLSDSEGYYKFIVQDDGIGFNPDDITPGVGLNSMKDRMDMLGGNFTLTSSENHGTTITMEVPC